MTEQRTISARAWAGLLVLALVWGASFLSVRIALNEITPLWSVAWRVGLGAAVLLLYLAIRRIALPRGRVWLALMMMGLLNNVVPFSLMAWGQLHIESGLAGILNAATAIFGVLVAALVFDDERLTTRRAVGVSLGFAGAATAIGWEALAALDPRSLAQIAVLAGTVSYALAGAWGRLELGALRPEAAATGMLVCSTLVMIPLAYAVEGGPRLDLSSATWAAIGYYAVIATAGAYLLYYRVLRAAGSGNLMLVTLLVAPIAIVLGALVLGEDLPRRAYAGFALLAMGLAMLDGRIVRLGRAPGAARG